MQTAPPVLDPNEAPPESRHPPDETLAGYHATHKRPPAFGAPDGHPYTVSVEVERTANLRLPYSGFLVFPRWAETGVGIVGHIETPTLVKSRSEKLARSELGALTLVEIQRLLDQATGGGVSDADRAHPANIPPRDNDP